MRELPRGPDDASPRRVVFVVGRVGRVRRLAPRSSARCASRSSPVALAIVFWYSLAKRYTPYTQAFLGLAMAVAPVGGWIAAGGPRASGAVAARAGDRHVGRPASTCSTPARTSRSIGARACGRFPCASASPRSLAISRVLHVVTVLCSRSPAAPPASGCIYLAGVVVVAVLLVWEQSLVRADDLSQVKRAFDLNGWVGLLYLATTARRVSLDVTERMPDVTRVRRSSHASPSASRARAARSTPCARSPRCSSSAATSRSSSATTAAGC